MNDKTILLEVSGNTMQKLILCLMLLMLVFAQARAAEEEAPAPSSAYVSLGEPMVLNLTSNSKRLTFLQISADVLVSDSDIEETIKTHVPAIRHSLIILLSEQNAGDIKSPSKREEIRKQATTQVQALIADLSGAKEKTEILFSSILVQ